LIFLLSVPVRYLSRRHMTIAYLEFDKQREEAPDVVEGIDPLAHIDDPPGLIEELLQFHNSQTERRLDRRNGRCIKCETF
jgi:hypothetical protein